MPRVRDIAGFDVRDTTTAAFVRFLKARLRRHRGTIVLFANANFIVKCRHLSNAVGTRPDLFLVGDGVALDAAAKLLFGRRFRENMNGTDFTPHLLTCLDPDTGVFLLGASPDTVAGAAAAFSRTAPVRIAGTLDGYSMWQDEAATLARIRDARPQVLLVALGNPLQEEWILRNADALDVPLIMGVGALFEFVAGTKPRAPEALRRLRLEWAHRLALEPQRLAGRYTIGIARFFAAVVGHRARRALCADSKP